VIRTFSLSGVEVDQRFEDVLRLVLAGRGRYVVDRLRRLVTVTGNEVERENFTGLLAYLSPRWKAKKQLGAPTPWRILWVVDGFGLADFPDELDGFDFRAVPWKKVFAWLAEQTDCPVIRTFCPTGTFTYIPSHPGKKYTLAEVIDALNEALGRMGMVLVRGNHSFALLSDDWDIPDTSRRLTPADLPKYGNSEVVSVLIAPRSREAAAVAPEVRKVLGPGGSARVLDTLNLLLVRDRAVHLRRACTTIRELDSRKCE
jgi:hypothetical protein